MLVGLCVWIERKYSYASSRSFSAGIFDDPGWSTRISSFRNLLRYLIVFPIWPN